MINLLEMISYRDKRNFKPNNFTVGNDFSTILIKDKKVLISNCDLYLLDYFKFNTSRYVKTKVMKKSYRIHRMIMLPPDNMYVDHINGDTFDNRRSNLRIVTPYENSINRNSINSSTGVLGVSQHTNGGYYGRVARNGVTRCTKVCKSLKEAETLTINLRRNLDD